LLTTSFAVDYADESITLSDLRIRLETTRDFRKSSPGPRRWRRRALTPLARQIKKNSLGQAVSKISLPGLLGR